MSFERMGPILRSSLGASGVRYTAGDARIALHDNASAIGEMTAETFWTSMSRRAPADPLVFNDIKLGILERLDVALRGSFAEFGLRNHASIEATLVAAERAFEERLILLRSAASTEDQS